MGPWRRAARSVPPGNPGRASPVQISQEPPALARQIIVRLHELADLVQHIPQAVLKPPGFIKEPVKACFACPDTS
jgi:hypothetical protein